MTHDFSWVFQTSKMQLSSQLGNLLATPEMAIQSNPIKHDGNSCVWDLVPGMTFLDHHSCQGGDGSVLRIS